jgi:branched-chain amino acid transport system permease protein
MATQDAARTGFRDRMREAAHAARIDEVGKAWRRLPARARTFIPGIVLLAIAALYPWFYDNGLEGQDVPIIKEWPSVSTGVIMIVFVMMAVGLNVVVGYAGLLDLGYVAFYAVGAYTAGWLASGQFQQVKFHLGSAGIATETAGIHINVWLVLLFAGMLTAIAGILIGLPTLRLRGDYLAIVTLGFGEIIPQFVRNADDLHGFDLTHGTFGINPIDSPGFGTGLGDSLGLPVNFQQSFDKINLFYWSAIALLLITVFCSVRLRDSRLGRAWIAIREDETAAAAMGVPLMRTKTWAYAIGAFFGGVAGAFYASFKSGAFPSEFFFNISVFLLCMVVLGGMGSVWGVVIGGAILAYLNQEGLSNIGNYLNEKTPLNFEVAKYEFGIYGVIIVLMMLFRPIGLIPEGRRKQEIQEGHETGSLYGSTHT